MSGAPVLTTARCVLRGHDRSDFERLYQTWSDPGVTRHLGGQPWTAQDCWFRLMRYLGMWPLLGFGYWAVCDRSSGLYLGDVGYADFKRGLGPDFDGLPEAGWVLAPDAAGRGIATEAMSAAEAWLEGALGPVRRVCMIEPDNQASVRVANKLNYRAFGHAEYGGSPVTLFERRAA